MQGCAGLPWYAIIPGDMLLLPVPGWVCFALHVDPVGLLLWFLPQGIPALLKQDCFQRMQFSMNEIISSFYFFMDSDIDILDNPFWIFF